MNGGRPRVANLGSLVPVLATKHSFVAAIPAKCSVYELDSFQSYAKLSNWFASEMLLNWIILISVQYLISIILKLVYLSWRGF